MVKVVKVKKKPKDMKYKTIIYFFNFIYLLMFITSHDFMKIAFNFNTFKSTKQTATTMGISNYTKRPCKNIGHTCTFFQQAPQPWQTCFKVFQGCTMQQFASALSSDTYILPSETAKKENKSV